MKLFLPITYSRRPPDRRKAYVNEWKRYEQARFHALRELEDRPIHYGTLPFSLWVTLRVHWYEKHVRSVWQVTDWISHIFDGVLWDRQTAQCVYASARLKAIPYQMPETIDVLIRREAIR